MSKRKIATPKSIKSRSTKQTQSLINAYTLYTANKTKNCIKLLQTIIKEHPRSPNAYETLGLIYEDLSDFKKSFQFFYVAAFLKKTDISLWKRLYFFTLLLDMKKERIVILNEIYKLEKDCEVLNEKIVLCQEVKDEIGFLKGEIDKIIFTGINANIFNKISKLKRSFKSILFRRLMNVMIDNEIKSNENFNIAVIVFAFRFRLFSAIIPFMEKYINKEKSVCLILIYEISKLHSAKDIEPIKFENFNNNEIYRNAELILYYCEVLKSKSKLKESYAVLKYLENFEFQNMDDLNVEEQKFKDFGDEFKDNEQDCMLNIKIDLENEYTQFKSQKISDLKSECTIFDYTDDVELLDYTENKDLIKSVEETKGKFLCTNTYEHCKVNNSYENNIKSIESVHINDLNSINNVNTQIIDDQNYKYKINKIDCKNYNANLKSNTSIIDLEDDKIPEINYGNQKYSEIVYKNQKFKKFNYAIQKIEILKNNKEILKNNIEILKNNNEMMDNRKEILEIPESIFIPENTNKMAQSKPELNAIKLSHQNLDLTIQNSLKNSNLIKFNEKSKKNILNFVKKQIAPVLAGLDENTKSLNYYLDVLKNNPLDYTAKQAISDLYKKMGEIKLAKKYFVDRKELKLINGVACFDKKIFRYNKSECKKIRVMYNKINHIDVLSLKKFNDVKMSDVISAFKDLIDDCEANPFILSKNQKFKYVFSQDEKIYKNKDLREQVNLQSQHGLTMKEWSRVIINYTLACSLDGRMCEVKRFYFRVLNSISIRAHKRIYLKLVLIGIKIAVQNSDVDLLVDCVKALEHKKSGAFTGILYFFLGIISKGFKSSCVLVYQRNIQRCFKRTFLRNENLNCLENGECKIEDLMIKENVNLGETLCLQETKHDKADDNLNTNLTNLELCKNNIDEIGNILVNNNVKDSHELVEISESKLSSKRLGGKVNEFAEYHQIIAEEFENFRLYRFLSSFLSNYIHTHTLDLIDNQINSFSHNLESSLLVSIIHTTKSIGRRTTNKNHHINKGIKILTDLLKDEKLNKSELEFVHYNLGRIYNQFNILGLAEMFYKKCLDSEDFELRMAALYNLILIYRKSGNKVLYEKTAKLIEEQNEQN